MVPGVRHLRQLLLGSVAFVGLLLPTSSATAQLPTGAPGLYAPDYGTLITQATALNQALGQNLGTGGGGHDARKPKRRTPGGRRSGDRKPSKRAPKPPTARQRATLRFAGDPAVSAAVEQTFAAGFGAPGVASEVVVADLLRLRAASHADLQAMGWSTTHLGDVAAYALIASYLSLHGGASVRRDVATGVRRVVHDALAVQPSVRRLSDARQQELAETLLLRVAYGIAHANTLSDQGDADGAETVRGQLRSFIESVYGVDPAKAQLSARGLVPKRG